MSDAHHPDDGHELHHLDDGHMQLESIGTHFNDGMTQPELYLSSNLDAYLDTVLQNDEDSLDNSQSGEPPSGSVTHVAFQTISRDRGKEPWSPFVGMNANTAIDLDHLPAAASQSDSVAATADTDSQVHRDDQSEAYGNECGIDEDATSSNKEASP